MFWLMLLLFTVIPVIELYTLIKVGQTIGALNTIAMVIIIGAIGAALAKSQGYQIMVKIQNTLNRGQMPGKELIEGAMILVGGVLLITPGFFSDVIGIFFLFPVTRKFFIFLAMKYLKRRIQNKQTFYYSRDYSHDFIQTDDFDNDEIIIDPPKIEK
jgi:UPF0716 protein FxsA